MRDDCFLPRLKNEDSDDLARFSSVSASSGDASLLVNGVSRPMGDAENLWCADASDTHPVVTLALPAPARVERVILKFDSDLNSDLMITLDPACVRAYRKTPPPTLVSDYTVELIDRGETVFKRVVCDSCIRCAVVTLSPTHCDTVRVTLEKTWGAERFGMYELRVYAANQ